MQLNFLFSLFVCLFALATGAPIPSGKGSETDKGSDNNPPRARTPTPNDSPNVPLPGRTGVYPDLGAGVATLFYGDDDMPEHMAHLQRNQAKYPSNKDPMPFLPAREKNKNRAEALRFVQPGGYWPNPHIKLDLAYRDEKHLAMFNNPHHAHTTTVEMLPKKESDKEGGHVSHLKETMQRLHLLGQTRPNPGWLPLDPHQRIGHEAPERYHALWKGPAVKQTVRKEVKLKDTTREETRPGTNLQPGRVSPPGHVWRPNMSGGSHRGAPTLVTGSDTRHPPRPENHDHYVHQQQKATEAQTAQKQASEAAKAASNWERIGSKVPTVKPPANMEYFKKNLDKFNAAHPVRPLPHLARLAEAPARLEHVPKPLNTPTNHAHQIHLPGHDATVHHHDPASPPAPHNIAHGSDPQHAQHTQKASSSGRGKSGLKRGASMSGDSRGRKKGRRT